MEGAIASASTRRVSQNVEDVIAWRAWRNERAHVVPSARPCTGQFRELAGGNAERPRELGTAVAVSWLRRVLLLNRWTAWRGSTGEKTIVESFAGLLVAW